MSKYSTDIISNNFTKGIVNSSALNFPDGAWYDSSNMIPNLDGSCYKRKGFETVGLNTPLESALTSGVAGGYRYSYVWKNAGNKGVDLLVLLIRGYLHFYQAVEGELSQVTVEENLYTSIDLTLYKIDGITDTEMAKLTPSFASINGELFLFSDKTENLRISIDGVVESTYSSTLDSYYIAFVSDIEILAEVFYPVERCLSPIETLISPTDNPATDVEEVAEHTLNLYNAGWSESQIEEYIAERGVMPSLAEIPALGFYTDPTTGKKEWSPDQIINANLPSDYAPIGALQKVIYEQGVLDSSSSTGTWIPSAPFKIVGEDYNTGGRWQLIVDRDIPEEYTEYTLRLSGIPLPYSGMSEFTFTRISARELRYTPTIEDLEVLGYTLFDDALASILGINIETSTFLIFGERWIGGTRSIRAAALYGGTVYLQPTSGDLTLDFSLFGNDETNRFEVCESYAGRLFFGGIDNSVGNLINKIYFSQLVNSSDDTLKCYQEASPTSDIDSALVATDGGFIAIPNTSRVYSIKTFKDSLYVFTNSGVFRVYGGERGFFTANSYTVEKVSEAICKSKQGVCVSDSFLYFCAVDGLYRLAYDYNVRGIVVERISDVVSKDFNSFIGTNVSMPSSIKLAYSSKGSSIYLFYLDSTPFSRNSYNKALCFNEKLKCFFKLDFNNALIKDTLTFNSEEVYLVTLNTSVDIATLTSRSYTDTIGSDTQGYDSFLVTGYNLAGDAKRKKSLNYVSIHTESTETSIDALGELDYPSSCSVSIQWDFTDSSAANKWSSEYEAYKIRRPLINEDGSFDTGYEVNTAKLKLPGRGTAFKLKFDSDEGKDMRLVGWDAQVLGGKRV